MFKTLQYILYIYGHMVDFVFLFWIFAHFFFMKTWQVDNLFAQKYLLDTDD